MAYPPMTPGGRETTSISRDAIKAGYKRVNTKAFFGYSMKKRHVSVNC